MTISPAYPDLLQNGNPADATQVMADFYQIQNDVNANAAENGANSSITSLSGLTTPLSIAQGGTGGSSASAARTALGAAAVGANGDITSLSGLTTPLSVAQGGTGGTTALGLAAFQNLSAAIVGDGSGNLTIAAAAVTSAMLASGLALPGSPTTTTQSAGDNSTKIATTAFVATGFGAIPVTASGIGQWAVLTGANPPSLPSGGTWAYFVFGVSGSTGAVTGSPKASVAAGGSSISGLGGDTALGFCWRIA